MRNRKRAFSFALALVMLMGMFPFTAVRASADIPLTLALDFVDLDTDELLTDDVKQGDTFGVALRFYGNDVEDSVCSADIYVKYDNTRVAKYEDAGRAYYGDYVEQVNFNRAGGTTVYVGWYNTKGLTVEEGEGKNKTTRVIESGTFVTLYFKAQEDLTLAELESVFQIVDGIEESTGTYKTKLTNDEYAPLSPAGIHYALDTTAHTYKVTLNINNEDYSGAENYPLSKTYDSGYKTPTPEVPDIYGWTFLGWYDGTASDAPEWDFNIPPAEDSDNQLYAHWERNKYTLTFDAGEGCELIDADNALTDGKITKPYKEAYTLTQTASIEGKDPGKEFDGWYDAETGGKLVTAWDATKDVILYAYYKDKPRFTVTFDANGHPDAKNMPEAQSVIIKYPVTEPTVTPTVAGYTFDGWYQDKTGETKWDFGTLIEEPRTVYAKWTINKYTLTFDPGDGNRMANGADATLEREYQQTYTITEKAENNDHFYDFDGWFTEGGTRVTEWDAESSLTLYARYKAKPTVEVTFDPGGQTIDGYPKTEKLVNGEAVPEPENVPAPDGYGFDGWYKETTAETKWNFEDPVTKNLTLYANWLRNRYTLTLQPVDGKLTGDAKSTVERLYANDYNLTETATPNDDTKEFLGWFTAAEGGVQVTVWDAKTDLTVYARYKKKADLTMTFNSDGTTYTTSTVEYGGKAAKPDNPTKDGHTFDSWRLDNGDAYDFNTAVKQNLTLYAKWNVNQYTLTFVPGDGNSMLNDAATTVTRDYGLSYPIAEEAVHSDHLLGFNGWFTASEGGSKLTAWDAKTNRTLYAQYKDKETVTVTFDLGTVEAPEGFSLTQKVVKGETIARPEDPKPDGFTFLSWYQDADYKVEWNFDTQVSAHRTLYAKWEQQYRTVTFDAGEGTLTGDVSVTKLYGESYKITQTASIEESDHSREFVGWYDAATGGNLVTTWGAKKNLTLYARYADKTRYAVTFDSNGQTDAANMPDGQSVIISDPATEPDVTPTAYGYTFAGWYQDSDGATAWDFSAPITANQTLYAKWTKNQYALTFVPGDGNSMKDNAALTVTRPYLDDYQITEEAVNGDYFLYFVGWFNAEEDGEQVSAWDASADLTVYARYANKETITVTFDPNGQEAENYPMEQKVVKGEAAKPPAPAPSAEGYSFEGWYQSAEKTAWDFSTTLDANIRLYAKWLVSKCTLTFDPGDGTIRGNNPVTRNYANDYTIVQTATPNDDAMEFVGWFTAKEGGEQITDWDVKTDLTLYAQYQKKAPLTVTFKTDGKTYSTASVEYGNTAKQPANPTKEGYSFDKWLLDGEDYNFDASVKENLTLTAGWIINQYTLTFNPGEGNAMSSDLASSVTRNYGSSYPISETTVSGNHFLAFLGWYDAETNGNRVTTWDATGNLTLYAHYTEKETAVVTFHPNSLTLDGYPLQQRVVKGDTVTALAPKPDGYTLLGWFRDAACSNPWDFNTTVNTNLTLYASWQRQSRTLTFDVGEGSLSGEEAVTKLYAESYEITQTASIEETDHSREFVGWYDEETGGNQVTTWDGKTNLTLYARYADKNRYTVAFDANGQDASNVPDEQSVIINDAADEPTEIPETAHYTFGGWYVDGQGQTPWDFAAPVTENLTLYAKWTPNSYTLTFNPGDGTMSEGASATVTRKYQDSYEFTEKAVNNSYFFAFAGWFDAKEGGAPVTAWDAESDLTVYAQYTEKDTVIMTFDSNGQDVSGYPLEQKTVKGEPGAAPTPAPTAEGYAFSGWYQDTTGKTAWNFDTTVNAPVRLYAKWTIRKYTLTLDPGEGSVIGDGSVTRNYANDYAITQTATPTDNAKEFLGWFDAKEGGAQVLTWSAQTNLTLYAQYKQKSALTMTFNSDGKTYKTVSVAYGDSATEPDRPTKEGYAFDKWLLEGEAYDFASPVTSNLTLYASWTINQYTLTFNPGSGNRMLNNASAVVTRNYENSYPVSEEAVNGNHLLGFAGWYDAPANGNRVTTWDAKTDLTLYARYTDKETVAITFDANALSVEGYPLRVNAVKGEVVSRPDDPTPDGYTFLGWYRNADCTVAWDFNTIVNADLTLYADWERQSRTLTFDAGEGLLSGEASVTNLYGESYEITQTASIEESDHSREFVGWYDAETAGNQVTLWDAKQTRTLYARYADKTRYTVTFDANGQDASNMPGAQSVISNDAAAEPESSPMAYGYLFAGWYLDSDGETAWSFDTAVTENLTLYAKWTSVAYTLTFEPGEGNSMADGANISVSRNYQNSYPLTEEAENSDYFLSFVGWYDSAEGGNPVTVWDATADLTVYAQYTNKPTVVMTYDSNGQDVDGYPAEQRTVKGEPTKAPTPDPSAKGYAFSGWYQDTTGKTPWNFSDVVNKSIRLYAKWTVNQYTLTFEPGDGNSLANGASATVTRNYKSSYPISEEAENSDYFLYFVGWYSAAQGGVRVTEWDAASDLTLYARYAEKGAVTVTFDPNGQTAEGYPFEQKTVKGETVTKPDVSPAAEGYTFLGWYQDAAGQSDWNFNTLVTADLRLYAKWEKDLPPYRLGDLNNDGYITAVDALLAIRISARMLPDMEEWQSLAADVDGNGSVTAQDALNIIKKASNSSFVFPAEQS